MRTISRDELDTILREHREWLADRTKGSRANLSEADLSRADLSRANLSGANLSGSYLSRADLSEADLSGTLLDGINWLAYIGIAPDANGIARAYKLTNASGEGPFNGGINYTKTAIVEAPALNTNPAEQCGEGINLATFAWCLNNKSSADYRLFLFEFAVSPENLCCPIGSDGKFRVKQATRIGECDWQGNLMEGQRPA